MRISSGNYDYYKQLYALSALNTATTITTAASETTEEQTEAVDFDRKRPPAMNFSQMGIELQGRMMKDSLQRPDMDAEEMKTRMEKLKTDMDAMPASPGASQNGTAVSLDEMSEEELRTMLKESLSSLFSQQGTAFSQFSSMLFDKLDA